jgi:hypothetical protein
VVPTSSFWSVMHRRSEVTQVAEVEMLTSLSQFVARPNRRSVSRQPRTVSPSRRP